jgi:nucleotide-binding universal stress UspA family protein
VQAHAFRGIAAIDSSPASLQAARLLAGYEGDRTRLEVMLLNVQARPIALWPSEGIDPGALDAALLEEGRLQLEPARALLAQAGFEPQAALRLGIPAESIVEESMRRGAGAIVMGTRGHGALSGFAVGSVALRVAHRAHIPTLLVKPDSRLPDALGRAVRVLVPLDGSPHATRAVRELLAWRGWLGDLRIDLLHVGPSQRLGIPDQWTSLQAEEATREARALLYVAKLDHELHEAAGVPSDEIARLAADLGSDLIAMGTRGLGALHHALVGSVALKAAHASAVPVVLVP